MSLNRSAVKVFMTDDEYAGLKRYPEIFNGGSEIGGIAIDFEIGIRRPMDAEFSDADGIGPVNGVDVVKPFGADTFGNLPASLFDGQVIAPLVIL